MTTVSLKQDPDWMAHRWARKNCASFISISPITSKDLLMRVDYHFGDETEATMFLLRWS
jgi:hypothetical protein